MDNKEKIKFDQALKEIETDFPGKIKLYHI